MSSRGFLFCLVEYCHLHGICWTSIKADSCLYEKMREYLNHFRHEIIDGLNGIRMQSSSRSE